MALEGQPWCVESVTWSVLGALATLAI